MSEPEWDGRGEREERKVMGQWETGPVVEGRWGEEVLALQWLRTRSDVLIAGSCAPSSGHSRVRILAWDGGLRLRCLPAASESEGG